MISVLILMLYSSQLISNLTGAYQTSLKRILLTAQLVTQVSFY
jgi:hypothetical protein